MPPQLEDAAASAVPADAISLASEPTPSSSGAVAAVPAAPSTAAGPATAAGPPKSRSLADDILGDLYSLQPVAPLSAEGGAGCASVRVPCTLLLEAPVFTAAQPDACSACSDRHVDIKTDV